MKSATNDQGALDEFPERELTRHVVLTSADHMAASAAARCSAASAEARQLLGPIGRPFGQRPAVAKVTPASLA